MATRSRPIYASAVTAGRRRRSEVTHLSGNPAVRHPSSNTAQTCGGKVVFAFLRYVRGGHTTVPQTCSAAVRDNTGPPSQRRPGIAHEQMREGNSATKKITKGSE